MALVRGFAWMFVLGVKIALPIMGAIFLTDIALGVIARSVPQMNVFLVGFPRQNWRRSVSTSFRSAELTSGSLPSSSVRAATCSPTCGNSSVP